MIFFHDLKRPSCAPDRLILTCTVGCEPKPQCPPKPRWWPWVSRARWAQTRPSNSTGWCHPTSGTTALRRAADRRRSGTYCRERRTTTHGCVRLTYTLLSSRSRHGPESDGLRENTRHKRSLKQLKGNLLWSRVEW